MVDNLTYTPTRIVFKLSRGIFELLSLSTTGLLKVPCRILLLTYPGLYGGDVHQGPGFYAKFYGRRSQGAHKVHVYTPGQIKTIWA